MGREMDAKQGFVIMTLITLFFLSLPLAITSIVLSQTHTSACDIKDIMGLNVKQYLLGIMHSLNSF